MTGSSICLRTQSSKTVKRRAQPSRFLPACNVAPLPRNISDDMGARHVVITDTNKERLDLAENLRK